MFSVQKMKRFDKNTANNHRRSSEWRQQESSTNLESPLKISFRRQRKVLHISLILRALGGDWSHLV